MNLLNKNYLNTREDFREDFKLLFAGSYINFDKMFKKLFEFKTKVKEINGMSEESIP